SADPPSPAASPFPYTTLFRSARPLHHLRRSPGHEHGGGRGLFGRRHPAALPRGLSRHVGRLPRAGQPARPAGLRATAGSAAWMARGLEGYTLGGGWSAGAVSAASCSFARVRSTAATGRATTLRPGSACLQDGTLYS